MNQTQQPIEPPVEPSTPPQPSPAKVALDSPWAVLAAAIGALAASWVFAWGALLVAWYGWSVFAANPYGSHEANMLAFRSSPLSINFGSLAMQAAGIVFVWQWIKVARPGTPSIAAELWLTRPSFPLHLWILTILASLGAMGAGSLITQLLQILGMLPVDAPLHDQDLSSIARMSVPEMLLTICVISLCAGIGEEVVCRGFLLKGLLKRWPAWVSILVSSAFFGAAHLDLSYMVSTGLMGAWFGYIALRTRSIAVVIVAHVLLDLYAITFHAVPPNSQASPLMFLATWGPTLIGIVCLPIVVLQIEQRTKKARAMDAGLESSATVFTSR